MLDPSGSWLAAIGPGTSVLEVAATAVAAGVVLGGFVAGSVLLVNGQRDGRDIKVADMGYCGGWCALAIVAVDLLVR